MLVLSSLVLSLVEILHLLISVYSWVIIISALISWVNPDPYNPIVQILNKLTIPVYSFIKRFIPTNIGGIDLAPLIVILFLKFIDLFIGKLAIEIFY